MFKSNEKFTLNVTHLWTFVTAIFKVPPWITVNDWINENNSHWMYVEHQSNYVKWIKLNL